MFDIKPIIKKNKEGLSEKSILTYGSILRNLYFKIFKKEIEDEEDLKDFSIHDDEILHYLGNIEGSKRKTQLAALLTITNGDVKEKYKEAMLSDAKHYDNEQKEQKMTPKQKDAWISIDDIKKTFNIYQELFKSIIKKSHINTKSDLQNMQSFILCCLYSGLMDIPPRRSLDYCEMKMKMKNIDPENDNYIDFKKKMFIFNKYKTSKYYSTQDIKISPKFFKILKQWRDLTDAEYMLFDTKGNKFNSVKMNQRLQKIFGKKGVSVNILRHVYLTNKYKNLPSLLEMEQTAKDMGHNLDMALEYVKKNDD